MLLPPLWYKVLPSVVLNHNHLKCLFKTQSPNPVQMKVLSRDPKNLSFKRHSPMSPSTLACISNLSFFHFQNWSILRSTSILISRMFQLIKGYLDSDVNGGREDLRTKHLQAQASGEEMPREQDSGPSWFLQPTITGQTFKTTFRRPCFQTVMYFSTKSFNRWPFQQS